MDELEALEKSLQDLKSQLTAKQAEKQGYLNTAADIEEVYERLSDDKKIIKEYRKSVKTFYNEKLEKFSGSLYKEQYKVKLNELLEAYDTVIDNIDTNMDRLNTARAQYENKAYKCNGLIGSIQASVNSVVHTIENWVN